MSILTYFTNIFTVIIFFSSPLLRHHYHSPLPLLLSLLSLSPLLFFLVPFLLLCLPFLPSPISTLPLLLPPPPPAFHSFPARARHVYRTMRLPIQGAGLRSLPTLGPLDELGQAILLHPRLLPGMGWGGGGEEGGGGQGVLALLRWSLAEAALAFLIFFLFISFFTPTSSAFLPLPPFAFSPPPSSSSPFPSPSLRLPLPPPTHLHPPPPAPRPPPLPPPPPC